MMIDLTGYRALVCGASRGIGRATATALASAGARCFLLARDEAALQEVVASLPGEHDYIAVDQRDAPALKRAMDTITADGPIHIWINNTGGPKGGPLAAADPEELSDAFSLHVIAAQHILKALLPGMREAGYGRIVNVISTSVKQPIPGLGVSNTIRGAMANWSKTLAAELGPLGITVNNLLPGFTATDRLQDIIDARSTQQGVSTDQVEKAMQGSVPAGRFASPEEPAQAITFLCSPLAGYINGINLPVDGGRTQSL